MNHPVVVARDNAAVVNMQGSKSNACVSTDGSSFTLNAMHGHDVHAVAFAQNQLGEVRTGDVSGTLNTNSNASGRNTPMAAVAHAVDVYNQTIDGDCAATLTEACGGTNTSGPKVMAQAMTVRRLTPRECERLQGFPDDYTAIPWRKKGADECPDGPRYKALGNSMAVNVVTWIGERIAAVHSRHEQRAAP
jgi:DNA (cytosine-5)-methyltransferase 1